ncbi:DNA-binding SARP family transcriptional activator [Saccharothrix ecbatanensis]|uniref:DNA-binding SARP family transcriptional activator n=1 Tax=Saccharothrix ecbatanensis TaxID=1105145 RepID=A0A7W9HHS0_9PSEU|nr:BTAD domain-containing putative transcriptional regulator [Saccharothrix ecbatanensis]MBB5802148.1 DNA-binding SARP family transcriptional activator [Saccharothrix ecbatanensis]
MTGALRVELLGTVRAWSGEREVALGSSRPRALFAMLALRSGGVGRDELVAGVWGIDAPPTAEGSVHTYVSTLRKALEPDRPRGTPSRVLVSAGSGYRLLVDGGLDVARFESSRDQARRLLVDGDPAAARRSLDEALELWRGEALAGLTGPFADAQRRRLGEARTTARELRAEAALASDAHAEVVAELAALVAEEPLRERARELLMLALHRSGRSAEALEVFRDARRVLVAELEVEPGQRLRAAHEHILSGTDPEPAKRRLSIVEPAGPPPDTELVGRDVELAAVRRLVDDVTTGAGRLLWVEGEMGIGKSALVSAVLAQALRAGHQIAHAVADELGSRFPLRLALDCLGVDTHSPDPRRAATARALRQERPAGSIFADSDPVFGAVDRLVALVEQLCADGPLVFALDDLQWSDETSTQVWHRLTTVARRLPLLLVGAARPVPYRAEIARLRRDVESGGGAVLDLAPLADTEVAGLVGRLVGASPGPGLRRIAARAGGNPLYVREVADALVRERVVEVDTGVADVAVHALDRVPVSLVSAVTGRLDFLSDPTREVLRWSALLGGEFVVSDLSVVLGTPVFDLAARLEEAIAAGVLRDAGPRMAFRHPLIRQALYEGTPASLRTALHQQAAQALAASGAPVDHVAEQLLAAAGEVGSWVVDWLVAQAPALVYRAPLVAVELLQRCLRSSVARDERDATLMAHLSSALFRIGRDTEAEEHARRALPRLRSPDLIAEVRWTLAYMPYRGARAEEAVAASREALADPVLSDMWRARLLSLLALVQRAGIGELDGAEVSARAAIEAGERAADPFAIGQALEVLWQVEAVRRDYPRAVAYLDQALDVVGTDVSLTDLRLLLLDNRIFTLQCLDRLDEATSSLRAAFELAGRGTPVAGLHLAAAVHQFWLGGWDAAVAGLEGVVGDPEFTGFGLREGGPVLLHGVVALIAAHRDDGVALATHLETGLTLPLVTEAYRENCDFLVAAQAMAAARDGDHAGAVAVLGTILDTRYADMMLRHQWLPELVRQALACGDLATAWAAVEACEAEAARETKEARASAAARRCRSVLAADPEGLAPVVGHYRAAGRTFELAQTLEDQAVLLARRGQAAEAEGVVGEAISLYRGFGALWDVRRAAARVAESA